MTDRPLSPEAAPPSHDPNGERAKQIVDRLRPTLGKEWTDAAILARPESAPPRATTDDKWPARRRMLALMNASYRLGFADASSKMRDRRPELAKDEDHARAALEAELEALHARIEAAQPPVPKLGVVEHGHEHIGYRACVECLGCGFTYSAEHFNDDGTGYACPVCGTNKSPEWEPTDNEPQAPLASSPPGAVGGAEPYYTTPETDPYFVLDFCEGAIRDAITLEDGLDAAEGEAVLQMIANAKRRALSPAAPQSEIAGLLDDIRRNRQKRWRPTLAQTDALLSHVATLTARLAEAERDAERLRQGMQFIWDALDNDDEAEAFRMADEMRRASRSTGETRP